MSNKAVNNSPTDNPKNKSSSSSSCTLKAKNDKSDINYANLKLTTNGTKLKNPGHNYRTLNRLIEKNGAINVKRQVPNRWSWYGRDLFTTIMNAPIRTNVIVFFVAYVISWWIFGFLWWIMGYLRGDFLPQHQLWHHIGNYTPCVQNCDGFWESLLFSIETQTTIGYGVRAVTQKCPEGIFLLQLQTILGYLIDSFALGIFFAKLSQAKYRTKTLTASKRAVVSLRNDVLNLMIRIGDLRRNPICEVQIYGLLYKDTITKEGEILMNEPFLIEFEPSYIHLLTPLVVCHPIDGQSPLHDMTADDLFAKNAELVVIIEGIVESTGQTTQYRTSYKPHEIIFGSYFQNIASRDRYGRLNIDYSRFDQIERLDSAGPYQL